VDIVIICAYDIGVLFLVDALKVRRYISGY